MIRIAVFAGSSRRESLNKKLARLAAQAVTDARELGQFIDLAEYPLPVYDGDLEAEQGVPAPARALAELLAQSVAWIVVSPENNASVPATLKNTIDWMSRLPDLDPFKGRVVALAAASPGAFGGVRGLYHLRAVFNTLGAEVIAQQYLLPRAHQAFDAEGRLADPKQAAQLVGFAQRVIAVARGLTA
jgi:chromate reductase